MGSFSIKNQPILKYPTLQSTGFLPNDPTSMFSKRTIIFNQKSTNFNPLQLKSIRFLPNDPHKHVFKTNHFRRKSINSKIPPTRLKSIGFLPNDHHKHGSKTNHFRRKST